MSPERRREVHMRIVDALETLPQDRIGEQIERLAHHAVQGEAWEKAVTYLQQAGVMALARSAYREAAARFDQALLALGHLPDSRQKLEQAIDLRLDARNALNPLREDQRMFDYLSEAKRLVETLGDKRRLGQASGYLAQYFWGIGDYEPALESAQRALAIANDHSEFGLSIQANLFLGMIFYAQGRYRPAIDFLKNNLVALEDKPSQVPAGMNALPAVISRAVLVWCAAELGEFAGAIALAEEAVQIAVAANKPFSLAQVHFAMGFLYLRQGDLQRAIPVLERNLTHCQTWNISAVWPRTAAALGAAYALAGRLGEALPLLERAVEQGASMRFIADHALQVAWLSEGHLRTGRLQDASARANRALELSRSHGERGHEAWVLRLLGEIASRQDPPDDELAQGHYRQALSLAQETGMRPLVAHCHLGLANLHRRTGKPEQAHQHLSTAATMYREMDMRFWLEQAEAER